MRRQEQVLAFGNLKAAVAVAPNVMVRAISSEYLPVQRILAARVGFLARYVPIVDMEQLLTGILRPASGDLVLALVTKVGAVDSLMLGLGQTTPLNVGDEVIVAYGRGWGCVHRLARLPGGLEPAQLISQCGLAASVAGNSRNSFTELEPIGLVGDRHGQVLNLASHPHY